MSPSLAHVGDPVAEARRRRTFAIISHPDAGKTTLTEKFSRTLVRLHRPLGLLSADELQS